MFRSNKKVRKPFWWWLLVGALVGAMAVLFGIGWKRVRTCCVRENESHVGGEEEVSQPAEVPASAEEKQD